ncbi:MAG: YIP1 family protein, partial [Bacillota bacterium]|nr:YIP1 family protein [Bacillota bacterium]
YLKKKLHGSYAGAIAILGLTFGAYLLFIAGKGFIFQSTDLKDMDLGSIILGFLALVGLFVLCSYLVTSIQDGEGTLGEIFKGVAYSMLPFILGCVTSTLISYIATTNELFLLNVIFGVGLAWSLLLVFISIAEIQNYTLGETIKSILITILFLVVILLVFAFVQMTIKQLFTFLIELVKEAFRHVLG